MTSRNAPLETFCDLIDFGIILVDGEGIVMLVNSVAREIALGWDLLEAGREGPLRTALP